YPEGTNCGVNPGHPDFTAPLVDALLTGNKQTPTLHILPSVDIDIDSDNNGTIERSELEDKIETTAPGKLIALNKDDDDENGAADYGDDGPYAENDDDLVPVKLSYEDVDADLTGMQLKLSHGAGVELWTTQKKDAPLSLEFTIGLDTDPTTFYAEGTGTAQPSITASLQKPDPTGFIALHVDEVVTTVMDLGLQAYRPQSEGPDYNAPFPKTPVPYASEADPGVGIRRNGDDDDGDSLADDPSCNGSDNRPEDTGITGENDLIEVLVTTLPVSPNGLTYVLRRTNDNINVWDNSNKSNAVLVSSNTRTFTVLSPPGDPDDLVTLWVEWVSMDAAQTESHLVLEARTDATDPQSVVAADTLRFYPFTSVVIAFGGDNQSPIDEDGDGRMSDPRDPDVAEDHEGAFDIAQDLYEAGWDVHAYNENVLDGGITGTAPYQEGGRVGLAGVRSCVRSSARMTLLKTGRKALPPAKPCQRLNVSAFAGRSDSDTRSR
ncbi:MAG: hypothetical protein WD049_01000, partial [Candidatus Paceibacterota bacterium]